ncbi:hypothetical protein [Microviridae sp.]|nr:hypothetical protein [Microviridae sp.]
MGRKRREQSKERNGIMKRRAKMSSRKSKRLFSRTAGRYHRRNNVTHVMRGGIRL